MEKIVALGTIFGSSVMFGTQFVPIKRFDAGDGMFAQFMTCIGIWFVGFTVFLYTGFGEFYPLAMLGGAAWAIGNLMAIPIIGELGLGQSLLIFSVTNCLMNFIVPTFGLFGEIPRPPEILWLNVFGLILVIVGGTMTSFVKTKPAELLCSKLSETQSMVGSGESPQCFQPSTRSLEEYFAKMSHSSEMQITESDGRMFSPKIRRGLAIFFALVSGVLYGCCMVPVVIIQDNPQVFGDVPTDGLPYCFSHYCGVLLVSTAAFVVYSLAKRNQPQINNQLVLPAMFSGVMWGIAFIGMLVATPVLSQAIVGPITAMIPGCVATVWSVFYFREIEMGRNLILLFGAIGVTVTGAICIGLSKLDL